MTHSPKVFSFFAGSGFLDLGFEYEGYEIALVNEHHEPFMNAYRHAREKMEIGQPEYGCHTIDIADFLVGEYKSQLKKSIEQEKRSSNLVFFIAGPPCPDFSVGGKNQGREGDKGRLTETYFELICQNHPDFFLFENVKGLWRTKKHRAFFEEMKQKARAEGYITTERMINSIEYGAPQDRDRIILLGFKDDLLKDLDKPFNQELGELEDGVFPWDKRIISPKKQIFALEWPQIANYIEDSYVAPPLEIPKESLKLTVEHWFNKNNVNAHPNSGHHFKPRAALIRFQSIDEGDVSKKSFKRLHRWRYSPTAAYGNNEVHIHPYKPRRISAAESLAIQSLPPEFELPSDMSLSNMFKTIGNGVPFLAARALACTIHEFLNEKK